MSPNHQETNMRDWKIASVSVIFSVVLVRAHKDITLQRNWKVVYAKWVYHCHPLRILVIIRPPGLLLKLVCSHIRLYGLSNG